MAVSHDLAVEMVAVEDLIPHPDNPRRGRVDLIVASLEQNGQYRPLIVSRKTGYILAGNHTWQAATALGWEAVSVAYVDNLDEAQERRILLADNKTADEATYDPHELIRLLELMQDEKDTGVGVGYAGSGYHSDDLMKLLAEQETTELKQTKSKAFPDCDTDLILTISGGALFCCVALPVSRWKYGFQSAGGPCRLARFYGGREPGDSKWHQPIFIDNAYKDYDHAVHVAAVKEWTPKYATVLDMMSPDQCREAGMPYTAPEQIIEWADELDQYAERVIVIPKTTESLDAIPDRFMLGYSVPTSHGGTPLPLDAFRGRDTHLLGGSPELQLRIMEELGSDVVSLDNNYLVKKARWGEVWLGPGSYTSMTQLVGFEAVYMAATLSFIAMTRHLGNRLPDVLDDPDDIPQTNWRTDDGDD